MGAQVVVIRMARKFTRGAEGAQSNLHPLCGFKIAFAACVKKHFARKGDAPSTQIAVRHGFAIMIVVVSLATRTLVHSVVSYGVMARLFVVSQTVFILLEFALTLTAP